MVKRYRMLKIVALISSILAVITSIRCLWYSYTILELKHENEAKNAQIEHIIDQRNRLIDGLKYYIEKEDYDI